MGISCTWHCGIRTPLTVSRLMVCEARFFFLSRSRIVRGPTRRLDINILGWKKIGHSTKTMGLNFIQLKLYYQRTKIHPVAGDGRSSTKVVLPANEDPPGCRRRPFQYQRCTTREQKSIRLPETGRSSTKVVLPENENPSGCRRRPFQY